MTLALFVSRSTEVVSTFGVAKSPGFFLCLPSRRGVCKVGNLFGVVSVVITFACRLVLIDFCWSVRASCVYFRSSSFVGVSFGS